MVVAVDYGDAGPRPLRWGASDPLEPSPQVLSCQIWSFQVKRLVLNYRDPPEKLDPSRVAPFKVTQGHWNRQGLTGCL